MTPHTGLPDAWVDKIFHKLTMAYGRDFLGRWEGIPLADVKADWAECLAGFAVNPDAIGYALSNLPDNKPPTAQDFRTIACRAPEASVPRLAAPAVNPTRLASEFAKLAVVRQAPGNDGPKAWVGRILARAAAGEKVSLYAMQAALKAGAPAA